MPADSMISTIEILSNSLVANRSLNALAIRFFVISDDAIGNLSFTYFILPKNFFKRV